MKNFKEFLKSMISIMIVMLGAYLTSFYIQHEISFTSVFVGIIGFFILFPAMKRWDRVLWGRNANLD